MRLATASNIIAAFLALSPVAIATPHASIARRHMHHHHKKHTLVKRGQCEFPSGKGLVSVTPGAMNAGWAMSPDQPCKPGMYCPYACPPGQLMAQWDPKATSYTYPASMNGGLYCNEDGEIEIPFPDKPLCYDGTGTYKVKNLAGSGVAICQTVLPGNEAMLIPTVVDSSATLAVPDTSYWCKTAAHYYINPPGVSVEDGCIWGSKDKPHGNWAAYVAGANELDSGETFVKIGWNPIYIEPDVPFRDEVPDYGVRIECEGKCAGLPCEIDPAVHKVNEVSQMKGAGAGGANFCVVSVSKGSTATLVVFTKGGSNDGGSEKGEKDKKTHKGGSGKKEEEGGGITQELVGKPEPDEEEEKEEEPTPTPTPTPTPIPTPTPTEPTPTPTPTSTSTVQSTTKTSSTRLTTKTPKPNTTQDGEVEGDETSTSSEDSAVYTDAPETTPLDDKMENIAIDRDSKEAPKFAKLEEDKTTEEYAAPSSSEADVLNVGGLLLTALFSLVVAIT